ncbi:Asp23/Gls24 family envelope stress response protein [Hazenella sp. IB182357]|uniref:Asp23/Gls24 family envelope stress response protein n=1 Tax=Polycladospora coralii TaxID=2771432 RepID=A0A926N9H1_9BACL|nr:Asp23/Gls24 family envelope stress response protein [Polycladospora coralii]MBS7529894.1 Asp23/Gls24 family envelope stress response protein [Polycladospora coralii]
MNENNNGFVRISDDVVAVIAGLAAGKTKGVSSMSAGVTEGWAKRVSGKNMTKGVMVEVGQMETAIDLRIVVEYGEKIHEVTRNLQEEVKEAVETMTGLRVVEVNVKVEGIEMKEPTEESKKVVEQRVK